uniref:energy transducer TonB n=1 Tax=Alistipes shahii TaxID=328814 RepID=UPI003FF034F9
MINCLLSILFTLLAGTGAVFAQSEVTPPAFNGAVIRVFMTRMAATVEKIAIEQQIPADSISPVVGIALQIDKAGNVAEWRYMDNTQEGRDHAEFAPATAATRRAMEKAYDRLGGTWSPATLADGSPVSYTSRMTIRIPVEKIRRAQDADPLLFMGENPDENFHAWAKMRIRYDGRFTEKGVEGVVHVRFYIEPDGRIAIGEVVQSPDERLTKEVLRVIRSSKGKWTPRKVRGVPQRTAYEYRVNYHTTTERKAPPCSGAFSWGSYRWWSIAFAFS